MIRPNALIGGGCILLSLAVRDFMREVGFRAKVKSVVLQCAVQDGKTLQLGPCTGGRWLRGEEPPPGDWDGHLVTILPSQRLLIDPSLGQSRRPGWDWMPDVAVLGLFDKPKAVQLYGRKFQPLSGIQDNTGRSGAIWLTHENNEWRGAPAALPEQRQAIVSELLRAFGRSATSPPAPFAGRSPMP